jgi:hypothetical protein
MSYDTIIVLYFPTHNSQFIRTKVCYHTSEFKPWIHQLLVACPS